MSVRPHRLLPIAALALGLMLGGCFTQNYQRGYILAEGALEQIPLGAPQEQVLITLGTPSTVATVSGEVFYYISKRTEQTSFLPEATTDQRVVAVYFDKSRRVQRIANYGIQDGKVFDSVSRLGCSRFSARSNCGRYRQARSGARSLGDSRSVVGSCFG